MRNGPTRHPASGENTASSRRTVSGASRAWVQEARSRRAGRTRHDRQRRRQRTSGPAASATNPVGNNCDAMHRGDASPTPTMTTLPRSDHQPASAMIPCAMAHPVMSLGHAHVMSPRHRPDAPIAVQKASQACPVVGPSRWRIPGRCVDLALASRKREWHFVCPPLLRVAGVAFRCRPPLVPGLHDVAAMPMASLNCWSVRAANRRMHPIATVV